MVVSDEDKILQNLMNTILFIAMEDGEITKDELAILKQVKLDVKSLRVKIDAVADGQDSEKEEYVLLKTFKKNLLQNAYDISKKDKKITQDERNLINSLIKVLMN